MLIKKLEQFKVIHPLEQMNISNCLQQPRQFPYQSGYRYERLITRYTYNVRQQCADAYRSNVQASDINNKNLHLTAPSGSYCVSHRGDKLFQNNFLIYNSPRKRNVLCLLFYVLSTKINK